MRTYPPKRSPYRRRNSCSKSRCDKRCGSRDTYTSDLRSAIHHRDKQAPQDRKQEQDVESDEDEENKELEMEVEDCDYDGDNDNINDDDDDDDDDYDYDYDDDDDDNDQVEDDGDENEEQLALGKEEHEQSNDVTFTYGWGPQPPVGETKRCVVRRSANIVLLAHGNRSLYVLTIQRNQVTSVASTFSDHYRNRRSSSTTVTSYKL